MVNRPAGIVEHHPTHISNCNWCQHHWGEKQKPKKTSPFDFGVTEQES